MLRVYFRDHTDDSLVCRHLLAVKAEPRCEVAILAIVSGLGRTRFVTRTRFPMLSIAFGLKLRSEPVRETAKLYSPVL